MEYLAGAILALVISGLGRLLKYDQEQGFYPVILIVIAMYYVLFAVMDGSGGTIVAELMIAFVFMVVAILGSKISLLVVAMGLIAHGIFDLLHDHIIINTGVPEWWPSFCAVVDVVLGAFVLYIAKERSNKPLQPTTDAAAE